MNPKAYAGSDVARNLEVGLQTDCRSMPKTFKPGLKGFSSIPMYTDHALDPKP